MCTLVRGRRLQGAHSPDVRVLSMGVFPTQAIKSKVCDQDDVSVFVHMLCTFVFNACVDLLCAFVVMNLDNFGDCWS